MLTSLSIENIAVIEKADLVFDSGFNVLTGETGAGKSIILDSIHAILGDRTSRDRIRTGADVARVTALFENLSPSCVGKLSDLGVPCEDNTLLLQRQMTADGKNVVRINGMPGNVSLLKEIGKDLINIHGQHDNQILLNPSCHMDYLDAMADHAELLSAYREAFYRYRELNSECERLQNLDDKREERLSLLDFQIRELESAEIEIGEREALSKQRDKIRSAETLAKALNESAALLEGESDGIGVPQLLFQAARTLEPCLEHMKNLSEICEKLQGFGYEIQETADAIRSSLDELEFDPQLLEDMEARLDYLFRLSRKYGDSEEDMLAFLESARREKRELENREETLLSVQKARDKALGTVQKLADRLSERRIAIAAQFENAVCEQLRDLDMPKATVVCRRDRVALTARGQDDIEFLISVNPGEPPKPLVKIASGGELSRIMLAIKSVLADKDSIPTLIFDEIDTGISGHAAVQVGRRLKSISDSAQVLCVTHLAPIAAMANHHFRVEKTVDGGRTYTSVQPLNGEDRVKEIARILSGGSASETMLASARELIDKGC